MLEKQRDQQSLDLFTNTSPVLRDRIMRHNAMTTQQSLWPNRWERIGTRALEKEVVFNNLMHHINVETLREAFQALDGTKAQGIDGMTKEQYGRNLEENLTALSPADSQRVLQTTGQARSTNSEKRRANASSCNSVFRG